MGGFNSVIKLSENGVQETNEHTYILYIIKYRYIMWIWVVSVIISS